MDADQINTAESFAFEGAIGLPMAVLLGVTAAAVVAWLLWREREVMSGPWVVVIGCARTVALIVVIWLLLGPTHLTYVRTTKPVLITLLVDNSQSMDVVDVSAQADSLRWSIAAEADKSSQAIAICDRVLVTVDAALNACRKADRDIADRCTLAVVERHTDRAARAVDRAIEHLDGLAGELDRTDASLAEQARRALAKLEGPVRTSLRGARKAIADSRSSALADIRRPLETLTDHLTGVQRRATQLVRDVGSRFAGRREIAGSDSLNSLTRREKISRTLDQLEQTAFGALPDYVRVKRIRFDHIPEEIVSIESWDDALTIRADRADLLSPSGVDSAASPSVTTNLSAALDKLARDAATESTTMAILISDGMHNEPEGPHPQEVASQLTDLPVYVVPIGDVEPLRDVVLYRMSAPNAVVKDDSIVITAIVTAFECAGEEATVALRRDGKLIEHRTVMFERNRVDERLSFRVPAEEVGRFEFELSIDPLSDEASEDNNRGQVFVRVLRDNTRLLLADHMARWEFRYLQQLFRRDERVESDELLFAPRLLATGAMEATRRLPTTVEQWEEYDVVILGDLNSEQLRGESQRSLDEYVRQRGGKLIVIAGRDHMPRRFVGQPLLDLLPVEKGDSPTNSRQGFGLSLTTEGETHLVTSVTKQGTSNRQAWGELYHAMPFYSLSPYCRPKPSARTLIQAVPRDRWNRDGATLADSPQAFLCWHAVGTGRVVYLSAPATYHLRFRRGDRYHHRFWGQLIRWITAEDLAAGSDRVRIQTDTNRYEQRDPVQVVVRLVAPSSVSLSGKTLQATATPKDGPAITIELTADDKLPGRYYGSFERLDPGAYRIAPEGEALAALPDVAEGSDDASTLITVAMVASAEMLNTRSNRTLLQQIAEVTGGQVVPPTAINEILELSSLAPEISERVEREPLWNRWSYLWIVFGCLTSEWVIRKRLGLV